MRTKNASKYPEPFPIDFENDRGIEVLQIEGDLQCPYCRETLFSAALWNVESWNDGNWAGICPHLIFIYTWGKDHPYQLNHVRSDFATIFIQKLTATQRYQDAVGNNVIPALTDYEILKFSSCSFEWGSDIGSSVAQSCWHFPEVVIPETIPFRTQIFHVNNYPDYINIAVSPDL